MTIQLNTHSVFSIGASLIQCKDLPKCGDVVALTDTDLMSGVLKHQKACKKAGVKPIYGVVLKLLHDEHYYNLTFLAENLTGYFNLIKLTSIANTDKDHVSYSDLSENSEGVICLSGDIGGPVAFSIIMQDMKAVLFHLKSLSAIYKDNFYLELIDHGMREQIYANQVMMKLSNRFNIKWVKTNDIRYLDREDAFKHAILMADSMQRGLDPEWALYHGVDSAYPRDLGDNPYAEEIAERCNVEIPTGKIYLPHFPIPEGFSDEDEYLEHIVWNGFSDRGLPHTEEYEKRVEYELEVIKRMGFAGYFIVVSDYVGFAYDNGIPVGPGRGSGAGSIVAYCLRITNLDPIKFKLLFERFLNPERVSMPDFDIDFCMDRREEVIDYLKDKYGDECVGYIGTYMKIRAKSAWKMVARTYGIPPYEQDLVSKTLPEDKSLTEEGKKSLQDLVESEVMQDFLEENEHLRPALEVACQLEGPYRSYSKHPAGILLSNGPITNYVPIFTDASGNKISQFDYKDVEAAGLVKFDFLGLRNLTTINYASKLISDDFNIDDIPHDDEKTFELIQTGNTLGIFQIESDGMQALARELKPDCLEDIIAMVALYRPGPLGSGMVQDYIDVKHNRKPAKYPHPSLEELLKPTNGVIVYQEQVMSLAQIVAGYSLGEADLLRRAMGKKIPSEMAVHKEKFIEGSINNGYDEEFADYLFDLVTNFASYGFNRSHSAAYGLISYQTAYLKANYPNEYMAALIESWYKDIDTASKYIREAHDMGLDIVKPNVNISPPNTMSRDGQIFLGLNTIKGMSAGVATKIAKKAKYESLVDFIKKGKFSKKACDICIKAGAMDDIIDSHRADALTRVPIYIKQAKRKAGIDAIFEKDSKIEIPFTQPWSRRTLLEAEYDHLGYYRSGHPVQYLARECAVYGVTPISRWEEKQNSVICSVVHNIKIHTINRADGSESRMAWVTISDPTGYMEVTVFSSIFEEKEDVLRSGEPLIFLIERDMYKGNWTAKVEELFTFAEYRLQHTSAIHVLDKNIRTQYKSGALLVDASGYKSQCPLNIETIKKVCF